MATELPGPVGSLVMKTCLGLRVFLGLRDSSGLGLRVLGLVGFFRV